MEQPPGGDASDVPGSSTHEQVKLIVIVQTRQKQNVIFLMLFYSLFWSNFDNTNTIVVTEGQWSEGGKGTCTPSVVRP